MKSLAIRYGLLMFLGFTAFFLFMFAIGQGAEISNRLFNSLIHLGLITAVIRKFYLITDFQTGNYVSGVAMGVYASFIGVGLFTVFMFLFMQLNPAFFSGIMAHLPYENYVTPLSASMIIFVEGIAVSLIGSYLITRIIDAQYPDRQNA